jgi:gamma-glutamyltranspeptidase
MSWISAPVLVGLSVSVAMMATSTFTTLSLGALAPYLRASFHLTTFEVGRFPASCSRAPSLQLLHGLLDDGLDPQPALDRPRFRIAGDRVLLEHGLWDRAEEVAALGLEPVAERNVYLFGGGQAIMRTAHGTLIGGSDSRKDGYAAGW